MWRYGANTVKNQAIKKKNIYNIKVGLLGTEKKNVFSSFNSIIIRFSY
jgi:hypothetical protein